MPITTYTVDEIDESSLRRLFSSRRVTPGGAHGRRDQVIEVPISFDIETSRYEISDKQYRSWMYIWQAAIDHIVVIGRTWAEFERLMLKMSSAAEGSALTIWIHNLSYEFSFFGRRWPIKKMFARSIREPLSVTLDSPYDGITFRDSYALFGCGLAKMAKDTTTCRWEKGADFDYDSVRFDDTPMSPIEMGYCIKDVLILTECVRAAAQREGTKMMYSLPLTKTGYIRRRARRICNETPEWNMYKAKQKLDAKALMLYAAAFRGGDTHNNAPYGNMTIHDCYSADITSSYPWQMLIRRYPKSRPIYVDNITAYDLNYFKTQNYMYIAHITMHGIKFRGIQAHTYLSSAKCLKISKQWKSDNGRIVDADWAEMVITSVDMDIINRNYDIDSITVHEAVYHTESDLLPICFRRFLIKLYKDKTELKGIKGREDDYARAKADLNSAYGMTVSFPIRSEIGFTGDGWTEEHKFNELSIDEIEDDLVKMYKKKNWFLPYTIGVWVATYARMDLSEMIEAMGPAAVYWDTDSVKFIGSENKRHIDRLNKCRADMLKKAGYKLDDIAPKDIKGNRHMIGQWDIEYGGESFSIKSFGAKKYMIQHDDTGEEELTVAGLNKRKALAYLHSQGLSVLDVDTSTFIPEEHSGRTVSQYYDSEFELEIGNHTVHEMSCVSIYPASYTFHQQYEHTLYIMEMRKLAELEQSDNDILSVHLDVDD